jgi:hypothetical protein
MSSACLILILIRIALIEGSMRTCSFSFLAMCIGFRMISDDVLSVSLDKIYGKGYPTLLLLQGCCVVPQLGLRNFRDIMLQSDSLGHSSDMAVVYSTAYNVSIKARIIGRGEWRYHLRHTSATTGDVIWSLRVRGDGR